MNESYKQFKLQDLYVNLFMDDSKFTFIHLADTFIQSDLQLLCQRSHASGATRG